MAQGVPHRRWLRFRGHAQEDPDPEPADVHRHTAGGVEGRGHGEDGGWRMGDGEWMEATDWHGRWNSPGQRTRGGPWPMAEAQEIRYRLAFLFSLFIR